MMRALLIGYGKMGRLLAHLAPNYNIAISAIVDPHFDFNTPGLPESCLGANSLTVESIEACDVAFDFSNSKEILQRILVLAEAKKPYVVGTTGWEKNQSEAKKLIEHHQSSMIYSPNFSLGVALFARLVQMAGEIFSPFPQYEMGLVEIHHKNKQDAPSGTAKALLERLHRSYTPEIHTACLRSGTHPGTHELLIDSLEDTIQLSHIARNREGFARGALQAAYWLIDKKGYYTLDDMIEEIIHTKTPTKRRNP